MNPMNQKAQMHRNAPRRPQERTKRMKGLTTAKHCESPAKRKCEQMKGFREIKKKITRQNRKPENKIKKKTTK